MNSTKVSKKKLLFIVFSLAGGGAERVVAHLLNHLDKQKYSILLVMFENIQEYKIDSSVEIISLDKKTIVRRAHHKSEI